jgi:hypothetical protein
MGRRNLSLVNNSRVLNANAGHMPEHKQHIERYIVGLVACAISVDILSAALPPLIPYIVVLAVVFVVVRLVLFHTRNW